MKLKLLDFFYQESNVPKLQIVLMALVSGLANGCLLMIINSAAESVNKNEDIQIHYFLFFIFDLLLFIYTKQYSLKQATIAAEEGIYQVRTRITNKLRHTELAFIEQSDHSDIFTHITQDTSVISQSAVILINACQQGLVVVVCLLYIAWLSMTGFIMTMVILSSSVFLYLYNAATISSMLHKTTNKESQFFDAINHILVGFKEIKINKKKNDALFEYIESVSNEAKQMKLETGFYFVIGLMFGQTSFYVLCAAIIFILPLFSHTYVEEVASITVAILFLFGPVSTVVGALPIFARATVAVENIYQLEQDIDKFNGDLSQIAISAPDFENIEFKQVIFRYINSKERRAFAVGPLSFSIQCGEVLFIVGGNGSGKSTVLKLLTGLYQPLVGDIYLNGQLVDMDGYPYLRELYSTIFTDFHLFDRIYGIDIVNEDKMKSLLKEMDLDKKTAYKEGRFSNVDLSTGQKKRLAYIVSMLEDKQIYIFDEWAADQDPEFRRYFYEVLLKDLQAKGKTIIAVSHDDRYFSAADRIMTIEYGQIIGITSNKK
jgi:putative ATP-binding cassette transporter